MQRLGSQMAELDPRANDVLEFTVVVKEETLLSWRVDYGGEAEVWVPRSHCSLEKNGKTTHKLCIPQWLADEKGMLE